MNYDSSMQTVSWFRDRYREGTLTIKPPYQRKPVWMIRQKCYLIESILLGLPVPEIYIQQITQPNGDTTYAIVDGQQRIRTALQFIGSETDPNEQEYNKFALEKLTPTSQWKNQIFSALTDNEKTQFYGYRFAVRFLNTSNDDEVRDMFRRLNKFLMPLKAQELRNATYAGPFVRLVEDLANNEYWAVNRIVSPALIRRMNDVEFVSELLIGVLHGPQGGSAAIIDSYYEQYEDFENEFPDQQRATRLFNDTLDHVQRILPSIAETRWGNKTDFYTLFVALAHMLKTHDLPGSKIVGLRRSLDTFAKEVDRRLADEHAPVNRNAIMYVRAVEKGANDKKRRGDRHLALLAVLRRFFRDRE